MTQFSNSFIQGKEKGEISLLELRNSINCIISSAETATLTPATAVKLKDEAGAQIVVEKVTSASADVFFGFIPYEIRTNEHVALDQIKVVGNEEVMIMEAAGAVARGATIEYIIASNKVQGITTGKKIGIALDKATADGDLIRVQIQGMGL